MRCSSSRSTPGTLFIVRKLVSKGCYILNHLKAPVSRAFYYIRSLRNGVVLCSLLLGCSLTLHDLLLLQVALEINYEV